MERPPLILKRYSLSITTLLKTRELKTLSALHRFLALGTMPALPAVQNMKVNTS